MTFYAVVELEISNRPGLEPYMVSVKDTIVKHGGRFLVRGGAAKLIEGGPEPKIVVIVEFPDAGAFDRCYVGASSLDDNRRASLGGPF